MYFNGQLQMGESAQLMDLMQPYLPGLPLWLYFVEAFHPYFLEPRLYFGYALLGLVLLLPSTRRMTWRNAKWSIPLATVALLAVPMYFANARNDVGDYYAALFVDPLLGLAAGAVAAIAARGASRTRRGSLYVGLVGALLCALKSTGAVFAAAIAVVVVWQVLRSASNRSSRLIRAALVVAPALIVSLLWRALLAWHGIADDQFEAQGQRPLEWSMVGEHWERLSRTPFAAEISAEPSGWVPMGSIALLGALLSLALVGLVLALRPNRSTIVAYSGALVVAVIAFEVGLFGLVHGAFLGDYLSFGRYHSTPLTMVLVFVVMTSAMHRWPVGPHWGAREGRGLLAGMLVLGILQFPLRLPESHEPAWRPDATEQAELLYQAMGFAMSWYPEEVDPRAAIVVQAGFLDPIGFHHQVYFDLIGMPFVVAPMPGTIGVPVIFDEPEQLRREEAARQRFQTEVIDQVDYVWVAWTDPTTAGRYTRIFPAGFLPEQLYRVENGALVAIG